MATIRLQRLCIYDTNSGLSLKSDAGDYSSYRIKEEIQQLGFELNHLPQRQPDYKVFPDRISALSQTLSARDMVAILGQLPLYIANRISWAAGSLDCMKQLKPLYVSESDNNPMLTCLAIESILKEKGCLTANQLIRILFKPEVLQINIAHQLEKN